MNKPVLEKSQNILLISGLYIFALGSSFSIAITQTGIVISIAGMILLLINKILQGRKPDFFKIHIWFYMIIVYLFIHFILNLVSETPYKSLSEMLKQEWIIVLLPIVLIAPLDEKREERLWKILFLSGAIMGLYGIFQTYTGVRLFQEAGLMHRGYIFRNEGLFRGVLTYAGWQVPVSILIMTFALILPAGNFQKIASFSSILTLTGGFLNAARSTWFGLSLAFIIMLFFLPKKSIKVFLIVILILLYWLILFHPEIYMNPDLKRVVKSTHNKNLRDTTDRYIFLNTSVKIFKQYPLAGIGRGNFQKHALNLYGDEVSDDKKEYGTHPHSDILNMLVAGGLIGSISWIVLWLSCIYFLLRNLKLFSMNKPQILAGLAVLVCFLGSGLFQCYYTDLENSMIWWFIISMAFKHILRGNKI